MASPGTVVVNIIGKADQLKKSLDQADKDLSGFSDKLDHFGKTTMVTGAKFTAGMTLPIVAGLGAATKAAAEDELEQAKLAKTLQNTVGATKEVVAAVEKHIAGMAKSSTFSDSELRPSLEAAARATRNLTEAQDLVSTAMDLAAAKGVSLEEATSALIKANDGNVKGLKGLGIELKTQAVDQSKVRDLTLALEAAQIKHNVVLKDAKSTAADVALSQLDLEKAQNKLKGAQEGTIPVAKDLTSLMAELNQVVGGSQAAAMETSAEKSKQLKEDIGELSEKVGAALLPLLTKLVDLISPLIEKFANMSSGTQTAILVVVGLAAAIGPLITVVGALSVAMAFLAANPVVAVLVALGLLVAALVYAWQNSETFRDTVKNAFQAVVNGVKDGIGWILDGVDKLLGGFATMAEAASHIPGIGDKFKGVAETIRGLQTQVQGWADNMHTGLDLVKRSADKTSLALRQVRMPAGFIGPLAPGQVASTFIGPLQGSFIGPIQPGHAAGGPISGLSMVGEEGPELFVGHGTIIPNHALGGLGGTSVVNSYSINVSAIDPASAQEAVIAAIKEFERRNGSGWRAG